MKTLIALELIIAWHFINQIITFIIKSPQKLEKDRM